MLVELILSVFFISNDPLYLREVGPPYSNYHVALNVEKQLTPEFYMALTPYVIAEEMQDVGRGGAYLTFGYQPTENLKIELFHHSAHNLDVDTINGQPLEVDGIRVKWRLF